jgi:DNA polymerase elongation subunit (family B)
MASNLVFHLLDLYARDQRIEAETEDLRHVVYESDNDDYDDEISRVGRRYKKKANTGGKREYIIHLFGETAEGKSVRVDVVGYRPCFYLKLPEEGTLSAIDAIKQHMSLCKIPMDQVITKRVRHESFWGFSAKTKFPFLYLDFPSQAMWRDAKALFVNDKSTDSRKPIGGIYKAGQFPDVYEANIDPMLRFLHVQNLSPCGWVCIEDGMTILEEEDGVLTLTCDYQCVEPCTSPPRATAPFLLASWDIECYSATGDFPIAKSNGNWNKVGKVLLGLKEYDDIVDKIKELIANNSVRCVQKGRNAVQKVHQFLESVEFAELIIAQTFDTEEKCVTFAKGTLGKYLEPCGDPVIQIGITLTRDCKTFERHLFVWPSCSPCEGIVLHVADTEKKMITNFFEWIVEINPDILIGYNVFGFDEKYVWERAVELDCVGESSPVHGLNRLQHLQGEVKLEEKLLSSSAMGDNFLYTWTTQGRLQIDLYHYIKRNIVLPSYKLDEVTKNFMSGKLKSYNVVGDKLVLDIAGAIKDIRAGRAICLLDAIGESITDKMVVETVEGSRLTVACPSDPDTLKELADAQKWVVVKDDVSPQDIFRLHRGSADDRAIVGRYCLQDCDLVIELYKKLEVFNNAMSMANVCTVPISYIFMRGQGIKAESLIFKACRERGILIPVLPPPRQPGDGGPEESYEGAIVLDPEPGFYHESPIGVADFASLYPSTIESENISHDSLVWVKDYTYDGKLICVQFGSDTYSEVDGYGYTDIEFDIWRPDPADTRKHPVKIKSGRRICRYAQPLDGTKSTLPEIIRSLLAARKAKRKEAEKEKDPERAALLDAEQLAYKLTGNSLYGQLGSGTFKVRLQHLAASVTAYGRKQILFAKAVIEKFYNGDEDKRCDVKCNAKIMYGDSVTGDTPLLITNSPYSMPEFVPIERIGDYKGWNVWRNGKQRQTPSEPLYVWTERGWTEIKYIIRHKLVPEKKLYRIETGAGYVDVTADHSLLLPDGTEVKPTDVSVGMKLLHCLYKCPSEWIHKVCEKNEIDYEYIKVQRAKEWLYDMHNSDISEKDTEIHSITEIMHPGTDTYVYDLETENHHFGVGPGALIVHNTDSLFVEFNPRNPETGERIKGREGRQAVIDLTAEAGHLVTQTLKPPHDFEFDKVFDPMLMFSKKRYAGLMFENNADDFVHKYMGIALKRRDNAPIVKTIFGGAMKKLLLEKDVPGATVLVHQLCKELIEGKVSLNQLTITKSLRADYADPSRIAHKALADRIARRDPGNAPASGDRIGFVYIRPKPGQIEAKLQGDRIETPMYVREKSLVPDYRFYIEHQIQNPVSQMFGILLEEIPGFDKRLLSDMPTDPDKRIAWRELRASEMLFQDALRKCSENDKKNFVTSFFGGGSGTNTVIEPVRVTRARAPVVKSEAVKKVVQANISNYILDSYLNNAITKKDREAKRKKETDKDKDKDKS